MLRIENAVMSEYSESMTGVQFASAMLSATYADADSTEAQWLTFRLLWALPWPARAVPATAIAARALGAVFDLTVLSRHTTRPLADSWVCWAARWTRRFGEAWAELIAATDPDAAPFPEPLPHPLMTSARPEGLECHNGEPEPGKSRTRAVTGSIQV